ncbi:YihY/virulence factor BrkB family protein [Saccharospirillum salsuginis]|uniref:tRNA-processing RNAse BN n=1 Tax=Saccharospirillum salsuginis TaxID=418750 RepID=A0A918KUL9_9GAMM|nr:YihY/virulence factor BrkB family protein [Saccharospirillum salsuginis]GGX74195.1 hypothetical protein GCM10007392_46960 [Saccharospirillum salsuginis]
MNFLNDQPLIQHAKYWLWQTDPKTKPWYERVALRLCRVLYAVIGELGKGQTNLHAMSLVYTTLLSIVPFLALSFSVLKGFGVHNQLEPVLRNLLLAPLGERSEEITANVMTFVDNVRVGVLGAVGLGLLVYTVISLVQKVERAFNEAWRVSQARPLAQRFSNYLSVILVGPLLAFSALGATATLIGSEPVTQFIESAPLGWLVSAITSLAPYGFIILLFTFLYVFIPNTRVRVRHALIGGFVAGTIWQSVGYVFTVFVVGSARFTAIYSGFAVGVLVLVWIYLAWLILLIGANVAYHSQNAGQIVNRRRTSPGAETDETVGLMLVYRVCQDFDRGEPSDSPQTLSSELGLDPDIMDRLIQRLIHYRILERTEDNGLRPTRPLAKITMYEVLKAIRATKTFPDSMLLPPVQDSIEALDRALESTFIGTTVETWVRPESDAT